MSAADTPSIPLAEQLGRHKLVRIPVHSLVQRRTLVIEPDALLLLEHRINRDRLRRILFDRVESVAVWRRPPWGLMLTGGLLMLAPGALLLLTEAPGPFIGGFLLALGAGAEIYWVTCGLTTIRIVRDREGKEFRSITSPRKLRRFLRTLEEQILLVQSAGLNRSAEADHEPGPDAAEPETPVQ